MKKLILAFSLLTTPLFATSTYLVVQGQTYGTVATNAIALNSYTVTTGNTNTFLLLIDSPTATATYTQNAFTNFTAVPTLITNVYTNSFGNTISNVVTVNLWTSNRVASATVVWPVIANIFANSNSTVTVSNGQWFNFRSGCIISNTATAPVTLILNY